MIEKIHNVHCIAYEVSTALLTSQNTLNICNESAD